MPDWTISLYHWRTLSGGEGGVDVTAACQHQTMSAERHDDVGNMLQQRPTRFDASLKHHLHCQITRLHCTGCNVRPQTTSRQDNLRCQTSPLVRCWPLVSRFELRRSDKSVLLAGKTL